MFDWQTRYRYWRWCMQMDDGSCCIPRHPRPLSVASSPRLWLFSQLVAAAAVAALHLSINSSVSQSVGHGGRRTRVDGRRLADLGKVRCGGSVPPGCEASFVRRRGCTAVRLAARRTLDLIAGCCDRVNLVMNDQSIHYHSGHPAQRLLYWM